MMTENKMKRRVPTRHEKYWTESGQGVGRSLVISVILYDRKIWGKEEDFISFFY